MIVSERLQLLLKFHRGVSHRITWTTQVQLHNVQQPTSIKHQKRKSLPEHCQNTEQYVCESDIVKLGKVLLVNFAAFSLSFSRLIN